MHNENNNIVSRKNNKKLMLIVAISLLVIIFVILITIVLLSSKNNKVNINKVDNPQINIVDDPKQNCYVNASDANDFTNKVKSYGNCEKYEVTYQSLKYVVEKNKNENFEAYTNKIFYLENELKYGDDNLSFTSHLLNSYVLNGDNEIDTFLFIFHEIPVIENPKYYIVLFNGNG